MDLYLTLFMEPGIIVDYLRSLSFRDRKEILEKQSGYVLGRILCLLDPEVVEKMIPAPKEYDRQEFIVRIIVTEALFLKGEQRDGTLTPTGKKILVSFVMGVLDADGENNE